METYKIVTDLAQLNQFIEFLPELNSDECYYVSLFARKKYHESAKNDKSNVKRFTAISKEWLFTKLHQLEIPLGGYTNKDLSPVHNDALAMYICINPRSFPKAQRRLIKDLADTIGNDAKDRNPSAMALTAIHKSKSRTCYVDFDFDGVTYGELEQVFNAILNRDSYHILHTRGGFHLLVDPRMVHEQHRKSWHVQLTQIEECDVRGDTLIPIPGCTQGGYTPWLQM